MEGWVGGSCAQSTIQREASRALTDGQPRLVRLSPDAAPGNDEEGVVSYPMTCHSGGTLEIYVEPFLPAPTLLVVGESPIAEALAQVAGTLGFSVDSRPDATMPVTLASSDTWVVVAAMGQGDEDVVESALRTEAAHVAVVASPRRAAAIVAELRGRGLTMEALGRLKSPAGLDIGAVTPGEVAVSILAEIVQRRRARVETPVPARAENEGTATTAIDPICGMTVEVATARWSSERDGQTTYFCAPGCKRQFDRAAPELLSLGASLEQVHGEK